MYARTGAPTLGEMPSRADDRAEARWAEVLRDGPLQGLAAMRLLLSSAIQHGVPQSLERAVAESLRQIEEEIATLRAVMTEMRERSAEEPGEGSS